MQEKTHLNLYPLVGDDYANSGGLELDDVLKRTPRILGNEN